LNSPYHQPSEQPPEASIEPLVAQPAPPVAPEATSPEVAESRVPASAVPAPRRRARTEDFALLSRLPTRKPETFDTDAILKAAWMVGGLAIGLWIIALFAKPNAPVEPVATPTPTAFMQEAPPIVMPGNDAAPVPEAISLTPAPAWTPQPPTRPGDPGLQAPAMQAPGMQDSGMPRDDAREYADPASEPVAMPAAADTPDPSNLFQ
jgi:hypothetical protein